MTAPPVDHTIVLVLLKCRYCCKPKAKVERGAAYVVLCCKIEQRGVA